MQPDATALLNGIKLVIVNTLLPELQTAQARQEAMYSVVLIDHLTARWEMEGALLLEERAELRALLTQALATVGGADELDSRVREALQATESAPSGPRTLDAANERMRSLVPALAQALPPNGGARLLELDAAIRAYMRNQHRRDQAIVQVGAISW